MKIKRILLVALTALALGLASRGEVSAIAGGLTGGVVSDLASAPETVIAGGLAGGVVNGVASTPETVTAGALPGGVTM